MNEPSGTWRILLAEALLGLGLGKMLLSILPVSLP